MKVLITGVSGFVQEAVAKGLVTVLADMPSIEVLVEGAGFVPQPKPMLAIQPAKKTAVKKAAKPAKAEGEAEAPRVTIRSRILDILKAGPNTVHQVIAGLRERGVTADVKLAGQHLYLLTRDKLVARDEEAGTWKLR